MGVYPLHKPGMSHGKTGSCIVSDAWKQKWNLPVPRTMQFRIPDCTSLYLESVLYLTITRDVESVTCNSVNKYLLTLLGAPPTVLNSHTILCLYGHTSSSWGFLFWPLEEILAYCEFLNIPSFILVLIKTLILCRNKVYGYCGHLFKFKWMSNWCTMT